MGSPVEALSLFLDALEEWGCEDNNERAAEIVKFIDGGCDLSAYEERAKLYVVRAPSPEEKP
jgi:hypothetical protein